MPLASALFPPHSLILFFIVFTQCFWFFCPGQQWIHSEHGNWWSDWPHENHERGHHDHSPAKTQRRRRRGGAEPSWDGIQRFSLGPHVKGLKTCEYIRNGWNSDNSLTLIIMQHMSSHQHFSLRLFIKIHSSRKEEASYDFVIILSPLYQ